MRFQMTKSGGVHPSVRLLALACESEGFGGFKYEYEFAKPARKWRFDLAWPDLRVAFEREGLGQGGTAGRHQRIGGFTSDIEKYNYAALCGWLLIRGTPDNLKTGKALFYLIEALKVRSPLCPPTSASETPTATSSKPRAKARRRAP